MRSNRRSSDSASSSNRRRRSRAALRPGPTPRALLQVAIDARLQFRRQRVRIGRAQHRQRRIVLVPRRISDELALSPSRASCSSASQSSRWLGHACAHSDAAFRSSAKAYCKCPFTCVSLIPVSAAISAPGHARHVAQHHAQTVNGLEARHPRGSIPRATMPAVPSAARHGFFSTAYRSSIT